MTPFRISKLEINNIGPFGNITLDFPEKPVDAVGKAEIHIFTGENGTGKSTILELLAISFQVQTNTHTNKARSEGGNFYTVCSDNIKRKWNVNFNLEAFFFREYRG